MQRYASALLELVVLGLIIACVIALYAVANPV